VANQKEHHGKGDVNATLERYGDLEDEEQVARLEK
jgi:hypothetical protein